MQINTTLLTEEEKRAYALILEIKTNAFQMKRLSEKNYKEPPVINFVARENALAQIRQCIDTQLVFLKTIEQRADRILTLCHTGK